MAVLNLDYYNGNDYYSDGNIEDVIEEIVKGNLDFYEAVGSNASYPILYHLSSERENILNWYPFKDTDDVLEVGAGCGAITGLLCRLCHKVTSVELSQKRSRINYERNKDYINLEIIVGNLNHVDLKQGYDYVILNGVFEYAISFTPSSDPYLMFFNEVKKYVKPSGKILIAIENRLGVKYFSGAKEDHTDNYFMGLNEYRGNDSVRTFSQKELEEIFKKCGIQNWKFYYPYPDYKFPVEVYTDENVNSGSYGRTYRNYQESRIKVFDELSMIQTLKEEKVMGIFSNSFLVEVSMDEASPSNVVYAKLNNSRRKAFRIATVICKDNDFYYIRKIALDKEAKSHIERIYQNQYVPIPEHFKYLEGKMQGNSIIYPYLAGDTVDVYLQKLVVQNKIADVLEEIDKIYTFLLTKSSKQTEIYGKEFKEYFGNTEICAEIECIKGCNIDLIFDNLYQQDGKYIIIDPEWVFNIWIPVAFIIWRAVNEWYAKHPNLELYLPRMQIYQRYGISQEISEKYREWAVHFADVYVSECNMDRFALPVYDVNINKALTYFNDRDVLVSSLYVNYGGKGYSEESKIEIRIRLEEKRFSFKIFLDHTRMISGLRWDPIEGKCCRCHVQTCYLDGTELSLTAMNSVSDEEGLFLTMDPQMEFLFSPGYYHIFEMTGEFEMLGENNLLEYMIKMEKSYKRLMKKEEKKYQILMSEKEFNYQKIMSEREQNYQKIMSEREQNYQKIMSEREQDYQKLMSEKEQDYQKLMLEKTEAVLRSNETRVELEKAHGKISCLTEELDKIKNSYWWKIINTLQKI